ncbi:MAG: hypothetical protein KGD70_16390 [Candidatus Lokiarchaeota archaeon]|nr:hypothetical protein [Candidatus Lokiarchaeota archaeon]
MIWQIEKAPKLKNKKIIDLGNELTLIYLIYLDHVEFRNCNSLTMRPCVREIVGWKAGENSEAICICSDKPAKTNWQSSNKRIRSSYSEK